MQFLYPNVIFLMLLPTLFLIFLLFKQKNSLEQHFSKEALKKLVVNSNALSLKARNVFLFISLILLIIALARPVANEKDKEFEQSLIPIVIALDISKSMNATDIAPSRLALANKKLSNIISLSKNSALGVILFANTPFILSPLTQDFVSLNSMVKNLDKDISLQEGSNILSTLEASKELLKDFENKNLIILTDGGNEKNYEKEIDYANENKINVNIITIATTKPTAIKDNNGFITDEEGKIVMVKLNENIKQLALQTNGAYINYTNSNSDISQILSFINTKSKKDRFDNKKFKSYTELFYYPLALGLFLILIAFSSFPKFSKNTMVLFFIVCFYNTQNINASFLNFQTLKQAKESYENGNYPEAIKEYKDATKNIQTYYNLGNAYYKNNEYKKAIENYSKVITSDTSLEHKKLHNMGNAYANLQEYDKAIEMYEKALKLENDKETKENLEKIKELKNNQNNKDNDKNQENHKDDKNNKQEQKQDSKQNDNQEQNKKTEQNQNSKQDKKEEKDTQDKKEKSKENKSTQYKHEQINNKEISQKEEDKWIKSLENKTIPALLQRYDPKENEANYNNVKPY